MGVLAAFALILLGLVCLMLAAPWLVTMACALGIAGLWAALVVWACRYRSEQDMLRDSRGELERPRVQVSQRTTVTQLNPPPEVAASWIVRRSDRRELPWTRQ